MTSLDTILHGIVGKSEQFAVRVFYCPKIIERQAIL